MSINVLKYEEWKGTLLPVWYRFYSLFSTEINKRLKSPWLWVVLMLGFFLSISPGGFLSILFGLIFGMTELGDLSFQFYSLFQNGVMLFWFILFTAVSSSGMIANDLSSKAITLYFSKAIHRLDYIIGKFLVVNAVLSFLMLVPYLILILVAFLLSDASLGELLYHTWLIPAILFSQIMLMLVFSSLCMFFSSMSENRTYAAIGLFTSFIMPLIVTEILYEITENEKMYLLSPFSNLEQVMAKVYLQPLPYDFNWAYSLAFLIGMIFFCMAGVYFRLYIKEWSE